ncbi:MAG: carboxypeptidase-like regulatory domain-containing protein [Mucilaginibacter sp.]|nr:carboxypeptidase-like regulatory domain-containing protein [Mucilaginibacter sp.]
MKLIKYSLIFLLFFSMIVSASAQGGYKLSGKITDEKGEPIKSATVFISGSTKITMTNDSGFFIFNDIEPGAFQLSVQMLGYSPYNQSGMMKTSNVSVDISLHIRPIQINEVTIGGGESNWMAYYTIFKGQFLGTSTNAQECEILNPRVLHFYFNKKKGVLTADADKFLFIENKLLGYRIKYLLKDFEYDAKNNAAIYDGDTNFEELPGNDRMKKRWLKNRESAYKGSFLHFLRCVFTQTALQEGFIVNTLYKFSYKDRDTHDGPTVSIDSRPIRFDSLMTRIDSSLISLKFSPIYVSYNPKKAAEIINKGSYSKKKDVDLDDANASVVKLPLKDVVIDRKGSYLNYRAFVLKGEFGAKRIGDQLPFEY